MKYPNGEEVQVGDQIELWQGCHGEVVASMDADKYSNGYPAKDWRYLRIGVLIESDQAGLIHFIKPEKSFKLVQRRRNSGG